MIWSELLTRGYTVWWVVKTVASLVRGAISVTAKRSCCEFTVTGYTRVLSRHVISESMWATPVPLYSPGVFLGITLPVSLIPGTQVKSANISIDQVSVRKMTKGHELAGCKVLSIFSHLHWKVSPPVTQMKYSPFPHHLNIADSEKKERSSREYRNVL